MYSTELEFGHDFSTQSNVVVTDLPEVVIAADDGETPPDTTPLGTTAIEQAILSAGDDQPSHDDHAQEDATVIPPSEKTPEPADSIKKPPTPPELPTAIGSPDEDPESSEPTSDTNETRPVDVPNFHELNQGTPHVVARTAVNAKLIKMAQVELGLPTVERASVPDDRVDWSTDFPEYAPPTIDLPRGGTSFRKEGDNPDPADPREIAEFRSLETPEVQRDSEGYPLNPMGRTGLTGRGMLDKHGATPAADPILTRDNPDNGQKEALLIQRGDTGEWALPGGKVDDGEEAWQAAARELVEEAGVRGIELDFSTAPVVYAGYVDDSRNTDTAWMETTALHLHLTPEQARTVTIEAGSDADAAQWVEINHELYGRLFASHGQYLRLAVEGDLPANG